MVIKIIFQISLLILLSNNSFATDLKKVKLATSALTDKKPAIDQYSQWIHTYSKKYQIDPYIMLALIKVESDFDSQAVSATGDYSLAQINYKVWQKELKREGIELNFYKLKNNSAYAIEKMALILQILKKRHAKKDPYWFARYHSNTKKFKSKYLLKVKRQLATINTVTKPNIKSNKKMHLIAKD